MIDDRVVTVVEVAITQQTFKQLHIAQNAQDFDERCFIGHEYCPSITFIDCQKIKSPASLKALICMASRDGIESPT